MSCLLFAKSRSLRFQHWLPYSASRLHLETDSAVVVRPPWMHCGDRLGCRVPPVAAPPLLHVTPARDQQLRCQQTTALPGTIRAEIVICCTQESTKSGQRQPPSPQNSGARTCSREQESEQAEERRLLTCQDRIGALLLDVQVHRACCPCRWQRRP